MDARTARAGAAAKNKGDGEGAAYSLTQDAIIRMKQDDGRGAALSCRGGARELATTITRTSTHKGFQKMKTGER